MMAQSVKVIVYKSIFFQIMLLMGFAFSVFILKGNQSSLSTLTGGLSYFIPTLLFIWLIVKRSDPRKPAQFLIAFLAGEAGKLVLCGTLFLLSIFFLKTELLYALLGLAAAIVSFWIASFQSVYRRTS